MAKNLPAKAQQWGQAPLPKCWEGPQLPKQPGTVQNPWGVRLNSGLQVWLGVCGGGSAAGERAIGGGRRRVLLTFLTVWQAVAGSERTMWFRAVRVPPPLGTPYLWPTKSWGLV